MKSAFYLMIGGVLTKILGMIIKIVISRRIGTTGLGMYMLILPTFMLFIHCSQLGLPLALSKMIAEDNRNNKKLFFSILPILFIINVFLMILILYLAPFISTYLLHKEEVCISIKAIAFTIPFTSISSICRSYYFGKSRMIPHILSLLVEDIVRLLLIYFFLPKVLVYGVEIAVSFLVLSNVVSEASSTLILLLFLPRNLHIKRNDFIPNKNYIIDSLHIGLPTTTSRMIGSIGFFLEPIFLTNLLLSRGYSINYITEEYGVLSGYVLPLILLPSFFTLAISQALLPIISKEYSLGNKRNILHKLKQAIYYSLGIALPISILFMINPSFFLKIIYHTTRGSNYIRILTPICLLEYLESPLSSCLDAMGKTKDNMISSFIGMFTRLFFLFIFSFFKLGIYSLILSISFNILFTVIYQIYRIRKYLT